MQSRIGPVMALRTLGVACAGRRSLPNADDLVDGNASRITSS